MQKSILCAGLNQKRERRRKKQEKATKGKEY